MDLDKNEVSDPSAAVAHGLFCDFQHPLEESSVQCTEVPVGGTRTTVTKNKHTKHQGIFFLESLKKSKQMLEILDF